MDAVKVVAIESHDGHTPGESYTVTERTAAKLIARRLVKMAIPVRNKMAAPHPNKANPSPAAGGVQPSSVSPAAQVSHAMIAHSSGIGTLPPRGPGRPRLPRGPDGKPLR